MARRWPDQVAAVIGRRSPDVQVQIIEAGVGEPAVRASGMARHAAERHEAERAVQPLRRIARAHVEQQEGPSGRSRGLEERLHQGPAHAAAAMRAQHHQLHDLGPVPAVGARLQAELDRADQRLALEGGEQKPAALAHRFEHAPPVGLDLGRLEGQNEADRGAALDGIAQQQRRAPPAAPRRRQPRAAGS